MRLTTPSWKKTHVTETYTRAYIGGDSNEAHQATGLMTDDSQTREGAGAPTADLLKPILQIYWPNTITNEELHRRAEIEPISTQVKRRRWRWIGHVLRQQTTALTRIALRWTPDGQRKRGRPKETWRRTVEREMKEKGWTWGRLERVSADRHHWRALVEALCATWSTKRTR